MVDRKKYYYMPYGKNKGFTLIEIVFSIGISSILILIIGLLLSGSLDYSQHFRREFNSGFDLKYNMDNLSNEINSCDRILKISKKRIDFCVYPEKNSKIYHYISYRLEGKNLCRYAAQRKVKVESINWHSKSVGKNILMYSIDDFQCQIEGEVLILNWELNKDSYRQYIALRGEKI